MSELKMRVRDRDLRRIIFNHGPGPGTPLYEALAELQVRRDQACEEPDPESTPVPSGPRTSPLL